MPSRFVWLIPLASIVAALPARAEQEVGGATPPLIQPPSQRPGDVPPPEIGVGVGQIFIGALATVGSGIGILLGGAATKSKAFIYLSAAGAPAVGSWAVCGVGRGSPFYDGSCGPTEIGDYLEAIILALPMAYLGAAKFSPASGDGGADQGVGAGFGAALGIIVGTAVGATIGWHASKHRRAGPARATSAPPAPSPTSFEGLPDNRPHAVAPRAGIAISVPLLSFQF